MAELNRLNRSRQEARQTRRLVNHLRHLLRDDGEDGWVAYMPGELPVLFAIPVLFLTGLACVIGGLVWLTLSPGHWWKAAVICSSGRFSSGWPSSSRSAGDTGARRDGIDVAREVVSGSLCSRRARGYRPQRQHRHPSRIVLAHAIARSAAARTRSTSPFAQRAT